MKYLLPGQMGCNLPVAVRQGHKSLAEAPLNMRKLEDVGLERWKNKLGGDIPYFLLLRKFVKVI